LADAGCLGTVDDGGISFGSQPCDDCMSGTGSVGCCNEVATCYGGATDCPTVIDCYTQCETNGGGDAGGITDCENGCDSLSDGGATPAQALGTCELNNCATQCGLAAPVDAGGD
jgi:hypothetical protein